MKRGKLILFPIVIILAWLMISSCWVVVPSGHVGVVRTFGAVQSEAFPEGFHLKKPIADKVHKMDIRLTGASAEASAASKDLQIVKTQVTLQYSLTGPTAPSIYQKVGVRELVSVTILEPAIQESVKAITAKYTAEQLVTKRAEVKIEIQEAIKQFIFITLQEKGVATNAIEVANIAITDFDFSDEFNKAIEMKVKAEQEALQAKNEKLRRVTQAEAAKAEIELAAQAEAFKVKVESEERAAAIAREGKALAQNPQLIELRLAEKWDGVLPKFTGDAIPMLNVDSLVK